MTNISSINIVDAKESNNSDKKEEDEKPRTIFVGNVPANLSKWDIESLFGQIGPLKRCSIQYPNNFQKESDDRSTIAYVTYALPTDATAALSKLQHHKIGTGTLNLKLVKGRERPEKISSKFPRYQGPSDYSSPSNFEIKRPREKIKTISKKSRLIVRNLSFQATEEKLIEHFKSFGEIKETNLLRKSNGKLVGCAFIQFKKVSQAARALRELNLKPFLSRPIAIDWALPKVKYQEGEVKTEPDVKPAVEEITIKQDDSDDDLQIKDEKKPRGKKRKYSSDSEEDEKDVKVQKREKELKIRGPVENDADEGKTIFIRNLSFDTTAESIKEFFAEFGPVNYAVICKDPLTEHPKGTAFLKFFNTESVEKCMSKYEEDLSSFNLNSRQFYISVALSKNKLTQQLTTAAPKVEKKDNRNLYLVREGFIRPGSEASLGMSPHDISLRSSIHSHKKQKLKDLNTLISPTRLCVHNLPPNFNDNQLRTLFTRHGGSGARVTEAKIILDKKSLTLDGSKSKLFGFVSFTTHEHALAALRALNNNPDTFTQAKRPIVEFSLEKRTVLKAREKRVQKSRENNIKNQNLTENNENLTNRSKKNSKKLENKNKVETTEGQDQESTNLKKKNKKRAKDTLVKKINNEDSKGGAEPDSKIKKKKKLKGLAEAKEIKNIPTNDVQKNKKKLKLDKKESKENNKEVPAFRGIHSKVGISTIPSLKPKGVVLNSKTKKVKKLLPRRKREKKTKNKMKVDEDDGFEDKLKSYRRNTFVQSRQKSGKGKLKKKTKWFASPN